MSKIIGILSQTIESHCTVSQLPNVMLKDREWAVREIYYMDGG